MHPDTALQPGLKMATDLANRAMRKVSGYAAHLEKHGHTTEAVTPEKFGTLPVTTKAEYIRSHPLDHLMWDDAITAAGTWSSTSGSTGSPTFFPRDTIALDDSVVFYDRILRENFTVSDHSTLVIVCFAMGTWIGGSYTYQAGLELRNRGRRISVATPGIDVQAAVAILAKLGPRYEKVVLAGYPPFIKDVIDQSPEVALTQDISVLLAGEAITEVWRDHILDRLDIGDYPERVCLMYGTAEAGVMGHETPATTRVRRATRHDETLRAALFGADHHVAPTFVEFDPERRFTEVDDDGFLLFTIDSALPLIRYRINDTGSVRSGRRLRELLVAGGYGDIADRIDPAAGFIVLRGRPDVAATFYSANLFPADLAGAFENDAVSGVLTGKFIIDAQPDDHQNPVLRVHAELAAGTNAAPTGLGARLAELCLSSLVANNEEFRTLRATHGDRAAPQVELHRYGTGQFAVGAKHSYVGGAR